MYLPWNSESADVIIISQLASISTSHSNSVDHKQLQRKWKHGNVLREAKNCDAMSFEWKFERKPGTWKDYEFGTCHVCHQRSMRVRKLWCEKHNYCRSCGEFIPRLRSGDFSCQVGCIFLFIYNIYNVMS